MTNPVSSAVESRHAIVLKSHYSDAKSIITTIQCRLNQLYKNIEKTEDICTDLLTAIFRSRWVRC